MSFFLPLADERVVLTRRYRGSQVGATWLVRRDCEKLRLYARFLGHLFFLLHPLYMFEIDGSLCGCAF